MANLSVGESRIRLRPGTVCVAGLAALFLIVGALVAFWPFVPLSLVAFGLVSLFGLRYPHLAFTVAMAATPFYAVVIIRTPWLDVKLSQVLWALAAGSLFGERLVGRRQGRKLNLPTRLRTPMLAWIAVELVLILTSTMPMISLREWIQTLYFFLIFMTIVVWCSESKGWKDGLRGLAMGAILLVSLAWITVARGRSPLPSVLVQTQGGLHVELFWGGIITSPLLLGPSAARWGTFGLGPVEAASYVLWTLLVVLGFQMDRRQGSDKRWWIYFGAGFGFLLLTGSRAGWICFLVGLFLLLILLRRRRLLLPYSLIIVILVILAVFNPLINVRIVQIINLGQESNFLGRLALWRHAIQLFLARPWTGWGTGTFVLRNESVYGPVGYLVTKVGAHSFVFQIMAEMGISGLVVAAWFLASALSCLYKTPLAPRMSAARAGFLVATVSMLLMNLTYNGFRTEIFWVFLAFSVASAVKGAEESSDEQADQVGLRRDMESQAIGAI